MRRDIQPSDQLTDTSDLCSDISPGKFRRGFQNFPGVVHTETEEEMSYGRLFDINKRKIYFAIIYGQLITLKNIIETCHEKSKIIDCNDMNMACNYNQLHILRWCSTISNEYGGPVFPNSDGMDLACKFNNFDILLWGSNLQIDFECGIVPIYTEPILPTVAGMNWAAEYGFIRILKWGGSLPFFDIIKGRLSSIKKSSSLSNASIKSILGKIKRIFPSNVVMNELSSQEQSPKSVKWKHDNYNDDSLSSVAMGIQGGGPIIPSISGMNMACTNGHIHVLKWGIYHQCYLDIEKEIISKPIIPNVIGMNNAAGNGHLHILKWGVSTQIQTYCENKTYIVPNHLGMDLAAKNGHLNIIKWGAFFKLKGYISLLNKIKLLFYQGFRSKSDDNGDSRSYSGIYPQPKISRVTRGPILPTSDGMNIASKNNRIEVVKWCGINLNIYPSLIDFM
ncbi:MAG: hypothetical protein JKX76_02395 [Colwellia sp.]|nr:hypothetical protein [Colwellia sp.]